jgi:F0F1-type ATP synthase membrane subunit b/b'
MWRRTAFLIALILPWMAGPLWASEEASAGNPVLGISLRLLNMVLFFGGLVYLLARPIRGFFEKRTEDLRGKLGGSLRKEEEGKRLVREAEELLEGMETEVDKLHRKFEEERGRLRTELTASTEEAARRLRKDHQRALASLDEEAQKALAAHAFQAARRESLAYLKSHLTAADRARFLATLAGEP